MAVSFSCKCPERKKPVEQRAWYVTQYKWNTSDFVKAGGEYSDYSTVRCVECGRVGRTKANYVELLNHMDSVEAYNEHLNRKYTKDENGVWVKNKEG